MNRLAAAASAAVLMLAACPAFAAEPPSSTAQAAAPAADAAARFKAIYEREWKWRETEFAGADSEDADRPSSDHLPDATEAAWKRRLAYWENVLTELDAIPVDQLGHEDQINYGVYRYQVETLAEQVRFRDYEKPFNSDSSFWGDLGYTASQTFRNAEDYRRYIKLLGDVPRYFDEQIVNMRAGLKRGFTVQQVTMKGRDQSIAAVAEAAADKSPLYKPFLDMPATIPAEEQARLRAEGAAAIEASVKPAYARLLAFMRNDYEPKATKTLAAEAWPDGKAYYRAKIREFTTLDMAPDEIHQLGLKEVARIRAEMDAVIKEVGFKGTFAEFLTYLRTDPQFYAKTPEELLWRSAWVAKRVDGEMPRFFRIQPRQRFTIEPVAPEIAPFYTSGRGGPRTYWVNTYDLKSRPLYNVVALTLHESAPGHSMQMSLAAEHGDQPEFRRKYYISAYGEGWGLYSETLGLDMGVYETPYDRFGMLTYQMWRAARLVIDTGLHSKGWTRDQALSYLRDNTALANHEVTTEVDRYIAWPGQALSYYLGKMAIEAERDRAKAALGDKFDIRSFHDTILAMGSVPIPVMKSEVDRFIATGGKGPKPSEAPELMEAAS